MCTCGGEFQRTLLHWNKTTTIKSIPTLAQHRLFGVWGPMRGDKLFMKAMQEPLLFAKDKWMCMDAWTGGRKRPRMCFLPLKPENSLVPFNPYTRTSIYIGGDAALFVYQVQFLNGQLGGGDGANAVATDGGQAGDRARYEFLASLTAALYPCAQETSSAQGTACFLCTLCQLLAGR